jgi:hypothetical protein
VLLGKVCDRGEVDDCVGVDDAVQADSEVLADEVNLSRSAGKVRTLTRTNWTAPRRLATNWLSHRWPWVVRVTASPVCSAA